MQALVDIVRSGKALYAGISNYPHQAAEFAYRYLREHDTPCLLHQLKYNMLHREPEDEGMLAQAQENGSGFIVFSPLAQGLLTDRYLNGIPDNSRAAKDFSLKQNRITPELLDKIRDLNNIAAQRGQTLAQMALAWDLKDDLVTSVIIGASSLEQLQSNLQAIKNTDFSQEELAAIDEIVKR
jgi:L-glyceraldehyde 3-phosphate reductase